LPTASTIQRIINELDRRVPAANIHTLDLLVDDATARVRLTMLLIVVAGASALLLGVIGVYSVVSYTAAGRAREFGIRQALGADPRTILALVLGQGMRTAGIGVVLGLVGSLALTRYLQSLLFGVGSYDPSVYAVVTVLLLGVALAACYLPARRATRVAPTVALRES